MYLNIVTTIKAMAPLTSSELGDVLDNIAVAVADQMYVLYQEALNAIALINLETMTGDQLDKAASEYPDMLPRFQATYATAAQTVKDNAITKINTTISAGGAVAGQMFLNAASTASFPASGTLVVGVRGSINFEYVTYTNKSSLQFSPTAVLAFDHAASEPIVLATVGDRTYAGPFTVATRASQGAAKKTYTSTTSLVIYDGESEGTMDIVATMKGTAGNTPSQTILDFIGTVPFTTATTYNGSALSNSREEETDIELRARIRRHRQSLSTGTIDAIYEQVYNVDNAGQRAVFAQIVEDPSPVLPSMLYIDDGAAFTPTTEDLVSPILLIDAAIGGEDHFFVPRANTPIVCTLGENAAYVFANITVEKNGVPMTQGVGASQYLINPDYGCIRLNSSLAVNDHLEITSIKYYTGLIALVNKGIYGDRDDRETYPGAVGLGGWVQIRNPSISYVNVVGNITLDGLRPQDEVVSEITQSILNYVNGLGIGNSVVASKILSLCFIRGVREASISSPAANIIISDGALARINAGNINIT
jgi:hypothetical protein